ncbi:hypothetical protein [Amycolatopsis nalaikhensis]|uniref:STAS domain-containing protein n=1 Tax=Amycolatopsis nalaikhensis TaxID=715472 RepID=A0ABY8XU98_9PSEU|nr:hypothetical protein [Amycolatopsis sp. 2-2]WIV59257.1 hypothetical protein QP939_11820 [Amycolatopsis sp. 2-2]
MTALPWIKDGMVSTLADSPDPDPVLPSTGIEVGDVIEGTVTVRAHGPLDPDEFDGALTRAAGTGATTVLLDLAGVDRCSMEAVAVLLRFARVSGLTPQLVPSPVVRHRLKLLGLHHLLPPSTVPGDGR